MNKVLEIVAKIGSIILYPLFIPTYGIVLFCLAYTHDVHPFPTVLWIGAILGTLLMTCLIPLSAIAYLVHKGEIKDLYINDARERTTPYIYTICGFGFWTYFLWATLKLPSFMVIAALGVVVALTIVTIVNLWWKISAHLTAFGGLLGCMMSYDLGMGLMPSIWVVATVCMIALLLMYARLYLKAHTSTQVVAGMLLGLICTFVPNLIIYYVS